MTFNGLALLVLTIGLTTALPRPSPDGPGGGLDAAPELAKGALSAVGNVVSGIPVAGDLVSGLPIAGDLMGGGKDKKGGSLGGALGGGLGGGLGGALGGLPVVGGLVGGGGEETSGLVALITNLLDTVKGLIGNLPLVGGLLGSRSIGGGGGGPPAAPPSSQGQLAADIKAAIAAAEIPASSTTDKSGAPR